MNRRGFLGALAGLLAAPSLIEKLKPVPVQDAYEAYYTSYSKIVTLDRTTLDKFTLRDRAFVEYTEKALAESARRHMRAISEMYS